MFDFVRLPNPIERLEFDWVRLVFCSVLFDWIGRVWRKPVLSGKPFFSQPEVWKRQVHEAVNLDKLLKRQGMGNALLRVVKGIFVICEWYNHPYFLVVNLDFIRSRDP